MRGSIFELRSPSTGIISTDDGQYYFFHKDELQNCTIRQVEPGDVMEFEVTDKISPNDRYDRAINIRKVYQSSETASSPNPGIHPNIKLDRLNDDEKRIIEVLGDKNTGIFYITNGGDEITINSSKYRYFLVKPTDYFIKAFHLNREIVAVFSDYVSFEPRSLDVASKVYSRIESKTRLDRSCQIIICHDDNVEEKLVTSLKDTNLDQIVIPFTYRELLSKKAIEQTVHKRFQQYLFEADLFYTVQPIQNDVFFFGRRDFAHDLASKCKRNVHCGVFGLRRSGKTSLLLAVKRLLLQQNYPTVLIECGSLTSCDWRTALYNVVSDIYKQLDLEYEHYSLRKYQTGNISMLFEEDVDQIFDCIDKPVTLMFDEIELITFGISQGEESDNLWLNGVNYFYFWNTIKAYYSKNPSHISLLIAGTNPMISEEPKICKGPLPVGLFNDANPMYGQLSQANQGSYLQAFSDKDTKTMVNTLGGYMGLQFDSFVVARLTGDCGGHPYLIRLLCSYINKYIREENIERPLNVSRAIYDVASKGFDTSAEADKFFKMVLDILIRSYEKEYNALKILALEGDKTVTQLLDISTMPHLIGYGLVEENHGHYAIRYESIKRYLRGEYKYDRDGLYNGPRNPDHIFQNHREHGMIKKTQRRDKP